MYGNTDIKRKLIQMKIFEKSMLQKRINDLQKEIDELEKEILKEILVNEKFAS